jgi:DNA mismatch endonuclease, patch repair protein
MAPSRTYTDATKRTRSRSENVAEGSYGAAVADHLSREERSRLMARVRTRDTAPELALRRALWARGIRGWRVQPKVTGRPDLAWLSRRVAVFVDGAFWHGHPDYYRGQSGPFWDEKIDRNRDRDRRVNDELAGAGWIVVRVWDFEVERDLASCVERVETALQSAESPSEPLNSLAT